MSVDPHCAHTWEDGSDRCVICSETLTLEPPLDPPCPDCGNDPEDQSLHRWDCRRILPFGHPLERLQFGPPYVEAWEPWTCDHWRELEQARRGEAPPCQ